MVPIWVAVIAGVGGAALAFSLAAWAWVYFCNSPPNLDRVDDGIGTVEE